MAVSFPTLVQPMQDLLDPQPLSARIGTDEPGMGIGATTTCHFIGRGTRATSRQANQDQVGVAFLLLCLMQV